MINFENALLCDDIEVYAKAKENFSNSKTIQNNINKQNINEETDDKDINFCLENLNPQLPRYYSVIVWLVDNGAKYYKQYGNAFLFGECVSFNNISDISKTNFIYRLAKDMSQLNKI